MRRVHQVILIGSTLLISWLGMQAIHEGGHVLGAWISGGEVRRVILHPLTISRTDLGVNPHPLIVVWTGPVIGVIAPLLLWTFWESLRIPGVFVIRFFAGFCCIANGAYIAVGSFDQVGDCGEMLKHGSTPWQLWLFGAVTVAPGLCIWHGQGKEFGLGNAPKRVDERVVYSTVIAGFVMLTLACLFGGE